MKKRFYRNDRDLGNNVGEFVEAGCLFERVENTMLLVDDDRYIEFPYNEGLFNFAFEEKPNSKGSNSQNTDDDFPEPNGL